MCIQLNSVFTCYLKRWLGVPKWSNNQIVHLICNTIPFENYLRLRCSHLVNGYKFPPSFHGFRPSFLENLDETDRSEEQSAPGEFLEIMEVSPITAIPITFRYRKMMARALLDSDHMNGCKTERFHVWAEKSCVCIHCNSEKSPYHKCPFQTCN